MTAQITAELDDSAVAEVANDERSAAIDVVLRDLRSSADGLTNREAARRSMAARPHQLTRRKARSWPGDLVEQLTQPLAVVLAAAAVLAAVTGGGLLAAAIVTVIALNAVFAFVQEQHAEHAVEALAGYLPSTARVLRDGSPQDVDATTLVPGDVLIVQEGDRVSADARLVTGAVDVDLSTLTGESQPVTRAAGPSDAGVPLLRAENMLFSGTAVVGGDAKAVVTATGMHSEIGRIAALSQRVGGDRSPLEQQVRRVAKLSAVVSIIVALTFLPLGLAAGLSAAAAASFAIGMLVANVPEGLLPTITLALAAGVQTLARKGAVVKRLSAVETLGNTTVICTDKTGTLTQNRMRVTEVWMAAGSGTTDAYGRLTWAQGTEGHAAALAQLLFATAARASTADVAATGESGDPTELAVVRLAPSLQSSQVRASVRQAMFRFDPRVRLMSTVDLVDGSLWINVKGAPEAVLAVTTDIATRPGHDRPISALDRTQLAEAVSRLGERGLRLLAVARRPLTPGAPIPSNRTIAERGLCLLGLVAMVDPPRPEAKDAIARAHEA